ncbi:hypothetical protein F4780DRAFT_18691 [Xylariomycetidae sp. FL0641]|nr:hypothetical protein F4780DRAFT_18691 [Xylariomycetidae sp. FL0641]
MHSKMILSALRLPGLPNHSRCTGVASSSTTSTITTRTSTREEKKRSHESVVRGKIYIDTLPADLEPVRRLLEKYSGLRARDVDDHIYDMRDRLWEIYPYACIGHFRFLSLCPAPDPRYQAALKRLLQPSSSKAPADAPAPAFLDLGCCVGQVLRQLAFAGVDATRLHGCDLEPRFWEAGYDLFRDRGKLKARFVAGDLLAGDDSQEEDEAEPPPGDLRALDGKITFIHATSFFHLFSWDDQVRAAARMVRFLDPADPDVMIFGRHVGSTAKTAVSGAGAGGGGSGSPSLDVTTDGPARPGTAADHRRRRFLHTPETWQRLWDEVGRRTGTAWRTEMESMETKNNNNNSSSSSSPGGYDVNETLRRVTFGVYRA